jgi:hypothetical protein
VTLNELLHRFPRVVFVDFEYAVDANGRENVKCICFYVLPEGRMHRLWLHGCAPLRCPFPTDASTLFVAFGAKADIRCMIVLGWSVPERIIDARALARRATNGWRRQPLGPKGKVHYGLLAFLRLFGLDSIDAQEKDENRALALRDGSYSEAEQTKLLNYCAGDVAALVRLFLKLLRWVDLRADLFLGRFSVASARLIGLPIDMPMLHTLNEYKPRVANKLIAEANGPNGPWAPAGPRPPAAVVRVAEELHVCPYALCDATRYLFGLDQAEALAMGETPAHPIRDGGRVFDERRIRRAVTLIGERPVTPKKWKFSHKKFEALVVSLGVADWPRTATGQLATDAKTFKDMAAKCGDRIEQIRQVLKFAAQMRLGPLPVCPDGWCRYDPGDLRSLTGRSQPRTTECPLLRSRFERGVIQARPGFALVQADYVGQELAIAAYRSSDVAMQRAYESRDFYLYLAELAGAVPPGATKANHPRERELYKIVSLGVMFGQTPAGAARQLGISLSDAEALFAAHQKFFPRFWNWSESYLLKAQANKCICTPLGWRLYAHKNTKPRTVLNFAMQATGAEMTRVALCLLTEQGVNVCASLHDAVIVEVPSRLADFTADAVRVAMGKASALLLHGHTLKVEVKTFHHPDRLLDDKGRAMWNQVNDLIEEIRNAEVPLPA